MVSIHHKGIPGGGNIFDACYLQVQIAGLDGQTQNVLDVIPSFLLGIIIGVVGIVAKLGIKARYFYDVAQYHQQNAVQMCFLLKYFSAVSFDTGYCPSVLRFSDNARGAM